MGEIAAVDEMFIEADKEMYEDKRKKEQEGNFLLFY
jgi:hypothetical protein